MKNKIVAIDVSYSDKNDLPVISFGRVSGNRVYEINSRFMLVRAQNLIDELESETLTQSYLGWKGLTINIYRR